MKTERKGMLLVVSGPSGTGKGTLLSELLAKDATFGFSVSATTRAPRENEVQDVHYHFLSDAEYDKLIAEDAFLEHATVHGNRYGTLRREVEERMAKGQNVLLDIDVQGALNVMQQMPDCVSVFVLPPSLAELRRRLEGRGTEKQADVERRLSNAKGEMAQLGKYTYAIVNDQLEKAVHQLFAIVEAEKQKISRFHPVMEEE